MRGVVVAMVGLGLGLAMAQPAAAADYGFLRGSTGYEAPRYRNWEGFYVGGQGGIGSGGADFNGASNDLVAHMLRNSILEDQGHVSEWVTVGRADTGAEAQYGAFIGYNGQWGDVVLGLDASYNHTKINATDVGGLSRIITLSGNDFIITTTATSQITLDDFATVRGRVGYAFDRFLPYATAGVALGRASYSTTATVSYPIPKLAGTNTDSTLPAIDMSSTEGKSNSLIYGWSAGLGMDVAITNNIFLRAEYEYIQFSQMKLNLNNARAGIGVRF